MIPNLMPRVRGNLKVALSLAALAIGTALPYASALTPSENNAVAEKFFDTAWNKGDFDSVSNLLLPNVIDHSLVPGEKEGPEKFKQIVGMFRAAMPDVKMSIEDEIYVGDRVLHRWKVAGTHTAAPLFGVPPAGKSIILTGITIVRLEDGKFAERWTQLDQLGLLNQLGVVPAPPKDPNAPKHEATPLPKDQSGKFTPAQNNAIAEKFFDTAWNKGDFASVENLLSSQVVDHSLVPGEKEGPEKFKMIVGMFRSAMPDVKMTIEDEIYTGDKVAHRWMVRGTHTGTPLFGVPATQKPIVLTGITIVRLVNGQFAERWTQLDQLGLLRQLGLLPPPPGKGPAPKAAAAAKETSVNPNSAALGGAASINTSAGPSAAKPAPRSHAINLVSVRSFKMPVNRPKAPSEDFWVRDYMTGNWGGLRDQLYDAGWDFTFATLVQGFSIDAGSRGQESFLETISIASFDVYPGKMGGPADSQFHVTSAHVDNAVPKNAFAGFPLNIISSSDTYNTVKLFEFWYGQKFVDRKLEFRLGKCFPFVRISSARSASIFLNGSFNYPTFMGFGVGSTYLAAPFGLQVSYQPIPEIFIVGQISDGYDDPSGGTEPEGGLKVDFSKQEGAEGIFEVGYRRNQQPADLGLPGNYKLGLQIHTGEFTTKSPTPRTRHGNSAAYAIAEQMLVREDEVGIGKVQGLTAFTKATVLDDNVNTASFNIAAGLFYQGLIPTRTYDLLAVGYSHTTISGGVRSIARAAGNPIPDAEGVFETTYVLQIAPWWAFEFDYQFISNPRGLKNNDDINVYGLSSRFAF